MPEDINTLLKRAVECHQLQKIDDAESLYRKILDIDSNNPDANHNLGVIKDSRRLTDDALHLFQVALKSKPSEGQYWISYINALIKTNQLSVAKSVLAQGQKIGLSGPKVSELEQILSESPSEDEIRNLIGHYNEKQFGDAELEAKSLIQKYPNHNFSLKVLSAIYKNTGRLDESVDAIQKAVSIAPGDAEAHNNLGVSLKELGKLDQAEASYKKAVELKEDYAEAFNNLGTVQKELRRYIKSEENYRQAIELRPQYSDAYSNLGSLLKELGRLEDAAQTLRKAIELDDSSAVAFSNLGNVLKEKGKYLEAEEAFRNSIRIDPTYAETYSNLGNTLKELGKLDEAEDCCKKSVELNPTSSDVRYNYGLLLVSKNKYSEAAEQFRKSDFKKSRGFLLKCLYSLDKKEEFSKVVEDSISSDEVSAIVGSMVSRAETKFGTDHKNLFCQRPLDFVEKIDLSERCDFENIFVQATRDILELSLLPYKRQSLISNGLQTAGNLFDLENPSIKNIELTIRKEIDGYYEKHQTSSEGLITNFPNHYTLHAWLVKLDKGGELRPHIHENGWLSGSIYINVPLKEAENDGNLVVCMDEEPVEETGFESRSEIMDVVTGSMCLFPASLLHYTIPFSADEERIVLAFDLIPS